MFWRYVRLKRLPSLNLPMTLFQQLKQGQSSALIPLDLSAASDTVKHAVLIDWLKFWGGIINAPFN